jgi:Uma2 family endonuclease
MRVTEKQYEQFALEHPDEKWELHCGHLREKPAMTIEHNWAARRLARQLSRQLDENEYDIVVDQARVRRSASRVYIPDIFVVPMEYIRRAFSERPRRLEAYREPLPLVVEIWSPSTGQYDVDSKLPEYQRRGDIEIWRIHPYERTLIAWRRQPDGSYTETVFTEGTVELVGLPGVAIELAPLFELG